MIKKILQKLYTFLIYFFFYAPIIVLIVYSFNATKSRVNWSGFSLRWYKELFSNRQVLNSFYNTLLIGVASTILSTIMGTMGAVALYNKRGRFKNFMMDVNYLPILNPDIVIAVSLVALYNFMRLKFGYITIILSHVAFLTPYVLFNVMPRLNSMDPNLYEAALDLGANRWQAFRMVVLPEIKPGILSGALIAFTLSIDDFVVSFFTTGKGIQNISITVWSMARRGINPVINALSALMFLIMVILVVAINYRNKKEQEKKLEKFKNI
ncbi:MAG: ABC transporter permease [Ezakiella sp.]|nr:ABC transporter permease [Ezakiella sp.]MDY3947347.1 ABC transporter permease [Ezakiella sp.]